MDHRLNSEVCLATWAGTSRRPDLECARARISPNVAPAHSVLQTKIVISRSRPVDRGFSAVRSVLSLTHHPGGAIQAGPAQPARSAARRPLRWRTGGPGCLCPGWPARAARAAASTSAGPVRQSSRASAMAAISSLSVPLGPAWRPAPAIAKIGHERDTLLAADAQELVILGPPRGAPQRRCTSTALTRPARWPGPRRGVQV